MKTFHKSRYSAGEINSLAKSLTLLYERFNLNDAFIKEVIAIVKEKNAELSQLLLDSKNTETNTTLSVTDQNRDTAFLSFRDYCHIFESYFIPFKANSAREICNIIREIGWDIYQKGYAEENFKINHLIRTLETPDFVEHLKIIGAELLLSELKTTQANFDELYSKEVVLASNYSDYPNIREKKKEIADIIHLLVSYTKFKADYDKGIYEELCIKVFLVIDESTQIPDLKKQLTE